MPRKKRRTFTPQQKAEAVKICQPPDHRLDVLYAVEDAGLETVLVTQVRDGDLVDHVTADDLGLLLGGEATAILRGLRDMGTPDLAGGEVRFQLEQDSLSPALKGCVCKAKDHEDRRRPVLRPSIGDRHRWNASEPKLEQRHTDALGNVAHANLQHRPQMLRRSRGEAC
nr:hypothetical protein [Enhygromyxa salina]